MMPSPVPGASHGSHPPVIAHLVCPCQRAADPVLALCGMEVTGDARPANPGPEQSCVVCLDLARTALVARRCERCAR